VRFFRWLFRSRRRPPPPLDESAAYERCHGGRHTEVTLLSGPVEVQRGEPQPAPRLLPHLSGDYLRSCFEKRLTSRHSG